MLQNVCTVTRLFSDLLLSTVGQGGELVHKGCYVCLDSGPGAIITGRPLTDKHRICMQGTAKEDVEG